MLACVSRRKKQARRSAAMLAIGVARPRGLPPRGSPPRRCICARSTSLPPGIRSGFETLAEKAKGWPPSTGSAAANTMLWRSSVRVISRTSMISWAVSGTSIALQVAARAKLCQVNDSSAARPPLSAETSLCRQRSQWPPGRSLREPGRAPGGVMLPPMKTPDTIHRAPAPRQQTRPASPPPRLAPPQLWCPGTRAGVDTPASLAFTRDGRRMPPD